MALFEEMIGTLESFVDDFQKAARTFFDAIVAFIDRIRTWIVNTVRSIVDYLERLFNAVGKLLSAFVQLSLFYVPTILAFFIGGLMVSTGTGNGWGGWLIVLGIIWAGAITLIGLTYRARRSSKA